MGAPTSPLRSVLRVLPLAVPGLAFLALALFDFMRTPWFESPTTLYWFVLIITELCALGGAMVLVSGWRQRLPELAVLGSTIVTVSILPLVHGLTTPGVLYEANEATAFSVAITVPAGLIAALPLTLSPRSALSIALLRRWRAWSLSTVLAVSSGAVALLVWPNAVTAPTAGSPLAIALMVASVIGTSIWAVRHVRLYEIGGRKGSLVTAAAAMYLGMSTIVWNGTEAYSIAFWGAHVLDAIGVLGLIGGLLSTHRQHTSLTAVMGPVIERDPAAALECGLHPLVHHFVSELDRKDPITRDHVVRVAELTMRVGERAGMSGGDLRALGLGALMHDVGKLFVADEILNKPGSLTDAEFAAIKDHTRFGAELMAGSPVLEPAAGFVRWHHERPDGTGYPDGLVEADIPFGVTLISVCDTWDAMTFTRQYREGMPLEKATAILREGAGGQWTVRAVDLLLAEIEENGPVETPVLDGVGRGEHDEVDGGSHEGGAEHDAGASAVDTAADTAVDEHNADTCVCGDALPVATTMGPGRSVPTESPSERLMAVTASR